MLLETAKSHIEDRRLDSWKEIATYLNRDERTAKRWEKTRGLPVHRLPGARSGVFAFASEIECWQIQGSTATAEESNTMHPQGEEPAQISSNNPMVLAALETSRQPGRLFGQQQFSYSSLLLVVSLLLSGAVALCLIFLAKENRSNYASGSDAKLANRLSHAAPKEAEELYLNGRYFWNKRTPEDLNMALGLFKKAIERDPFYAQAYIGVADTYSLLVEYAALPPSEAYPSAIFAAKHAIALDPSLPEAHRSLAFSFFYWSWDRVQSEKEFRKALEIDPRDATAHHWFANTLMTSQRYQDALAEIEEARKLDPTSISVLADRGHILSYLGRNEESRQALLQVEKADPTFLPAHWYMAQAYLSGKDDRNYLDEDKAGRDDKPPKC